MTSKEGKELEMETVACDLCGSAESTPFLSGPDRMSGLKGCFTMVVCQNCGLLYQNPRPTAEAIARFYEGTYEPYVEAIQDEPSAIRRLRRRVGMRRRCRLVLEHKPPGHLLDVGCGTGIFLDAMRSHGWQVQGVEPNSRAARYCRDRLDLDVFAGPLEAADLPENAFDVVTLWDVLEHLTSPVAALQQVQRILKPDGLLVFRLPDTGSLAARLFGPYWAGWDLPRHYFALDHASVRNLLRRSGFDLVEANHEANYPSFVISCQWWLDDRWQRVDWPLRAASLVLKSLAVRLLMEPFLFLVGRVLERGSAMTVIARLEATTLHWSSV